ncbi:hypothetical protein P879_05087 [Paragonimus westermani]|uniref:GFO/IDH/MocA-like oxidoreductase domain-containing protein n=1 Tax=Paragonimus westermani TaxID=34504 RepID=A0A8T0DIE7_9TREM|nr:hypothetical protein P879_05087 [Paragonimus westermani]
MNVFTRLEYNHTRDFVKLFAICHLPMQIARSPNSPLNVIVCGYSSTSSVVLESLSSLNQSFNVCGFWDSNLHTCASPRLSGLRRIHGSFHDIVSDPDYDVVLLCFPPYVQYEVIRSWLNKRENLAMPAAQKKFPIVVLVPPISPCFNTSALFGARNCIGVAMPFRKFIPVALLHSHLKTSTESYPLSSLRRPSHLPSHWILGTVRSFHVRLSAVNPIQRGNYSWLCESGVMGGGLLNSYGAYLIDLAFILTGGMRFKSVSCICRTFDTQLYTYQNSIRRISAEDYLLISAEFEARSSDSQAAVAMLCLSSDLPSGCECSPQVPLSATQDSNDKFTLKIELTGSSGRLVLPETGDRIYWTPVHPLASDIVLNHERKNVGGVNYGPNRLSNLQKDDYIDMTNGKAEIEGVFNDARNEYWTPDGPTPYSVQIRKDGEPCEVAHISSSSDFASKSSSLEVQYASRDVWTHWFAHLPTCLMGDNLKQSLESLLAAPDHWSYIQRVLLATDKAARMRCCVDVATGERL